MKEDSERSGVCSQDDDLGNTSVQGLSRLVRALLQLSGMAGLLDNIEDLLGKSSIGNGPGCEIVSTNTEFYRHSTTWPAEKMVSRSELYMFGRGAHTSRSVLFVGHLELFRGGFLVGGQQICIARRMFAGMRIAYCELEKVWGFMETD